jgi:hydroxymethylbilane synthase
MSLARPLRIGTRGSPLALRQSGLVAAELERRGTPVELVTIKTSGDVLTGSLAAAGGKGLFVKEIEEALLRDRIDVAVHSLKDLPATLPVGLELAATPRRADPREVLFAGGGGALAELPAGFRVGTSSLRRRAQVLAVRADLELVELRGNVDTRLAKLAHGTVDAILLAAAGLERLGIEAPDARPLDPQRFVPAIGQGTLALEARVGDAAVLAVLRALDHAPTRAATAAERGFLAAIGGDCHTPLAAYAAVHDDRVSMIALVAEIDGSLVLGDTLEVPIESAADMGPRLADALLSRGAGDVIARAASSRP